MGFFDVIKKKYLVIIVSFFVGISVFIYLFFRSGREALIIVSQVNLFYLSIFFFISLLTFFLATLRHRFILKAYNKKIPFLILLRQFISGFAISYLTPAAMFGGEPLRAYMLKKEANIDLRTGAASILIDKFIEMLCLILFGVIGVILLMAHPEISFYWRTALFFIFLAFSLVILLFYYRSILKKGSFSSLLSIFRLNNFRKFKDAFYFLEEVEDKAAHFFLKHRKEFVYSLLSNIFRIIMMIIQMKILLFALGFNISLSNIIISLTFFVMAEIVPVPAALGFLEAGQAVAFSLFAQKSSLGLAFSAFLRTNSFIFVALGLSFISHFGWKMIEKFFK